MTKHRKIRPNSTNTENKSIILFFDIKNWPLYPYIIYYSFTLDTNELVVNDFLIKDLAKINVLTSQT